MTQKVVALYYNVNVYIKKILFSNHFKSYLKFYKQLQKKKH